MKKYLIALLLSLSCACTVAAVGCKDGNKADTSTSSSSSPTDETPEDTSAVAVRFENGEGYSFVSDVQNGDTVESGSSITFRLELGGFYLDSNPVVYLNGKATYFTEDNGNGSYTYTETITEETTISVTGVKKDRSMMDGTGAMETPFVVTKPIDLLHIAEQVNAGNTAYTRAAYILATNIDCKGAELKVIGDSSTEASVFSGSFTCNYESETGTLYDYSISNFTINSQDVNYVGLFGTVYADPSVESSGQFYGIKIKDFSINASIDKTASDSKTIVCGSLIGYSVGARLLLCEASNGEVNVIADESYFSFAGGLIGYQQAFYSADTGEYFPSEVTYTKVDVDVNVLKGMALYAGGITGYLTTNAAFLSTATIHNSYALGNVSGALRSGGLVGGIGQYTTVSNCYATGEIVAKCYQDINDPLTTSEEYCISSAGGLVGFAENDSSVNDCFFTGNTYAYAVSGKAYANANSFVGGGYEAGYVSATSAKYSLESCLANPDLSNKNILTDQLGWGAYDWVFTENQLPAINYETTQGNVVLNLTLKYVTKTGTINVLGVTETTLKYFDNSIQSMQSYAPLSDFFAANSLKFYLTADDNKYLSYGYFFDEACTKPVPYSYMPQKDVTLYVGFADVTPIVGTYYLNVNSDKEVRITFNADGTALYSDGVTSQSTPYSFDGESFTLESARLARYYLGDILVDEDDETLLSDPNFDLYRYLYYNFKGVKTSDGIALYDGVYYTASSPLTASTTPPTLKSHDGFKGTWVKTAGINKAYTFDGAGNWSYRYTAYIRNGYSYDVNTIEQASGTYTVNGGQMTFTHGGVEYTASFNSDGFLQIVGGGKTQLFYTADSYKGSWSGGNFTLSLQGIGETGVGKATLTYSDGSIADLIYERSEKYGYICVYYAHKTSEYVKDQIFGYFTYDLTTDTLLATLADFESATGYTQMNLFLLDAYNGEWVSDANELRGAEFDFNGFGSYSHFGMSGTIIITKNDTRTEVPYTLKDNLQGQFAYDGILYDLVYDEDENIVKISFNSLVRKDEMANIRFLDENGVSYSFDGRSPLSIGGTLTIGDATQYIYKSADNGNYTLYAVDDTATAIGTIIKEPDHYAIKFNATPDETTKLFVWNEFMGEWALSGEFALLDIGATGTNGIIKANFRGKTVEMRYISTSMLTFDYTANDGMPITYYVFIIQDETDPEPTLVLSETTNLYGEYIVCSKANELFGAWTYNGNNQFVNLTLQFDGVTSNYANGIARIDQTLYYYMIREKGIMMWSQEVAGSTQQTKYYRVEYTEDITNRSAYVKDGVAILLVDCDGLYLTEAKDSNDGSIVYFFDGENVKGNQGGLWVGDEMKYGYVIKEYTASNTAILELTDKATNKTYTATVDYSDRTNITLTIGAEITK